MRRLSIALVLTLMTSWASAADLKGIRLGMTEEALFSAYPELQEASRASPSACSNGDSPSTKICRFEFPLFIDRKPVNSGLSTFASLSARDWSITFIESRVEEVSVSVAMSISLGDLTDPLREKYGKPTAFKKGEAKSGPATSQKFEQARWSLPGAVLRSFASGGSGGVTLSSDKAERASRSAEKKNLEQAAKDL